MASSTPSSRPVWTGSISFGLVTIPVKLYTAVREKRLAFRSLHDQDKVPLKQKLVCPADGKEVHPEHVVKGFEIEKDRYVIVRQAELDAVAPKATKAIEIQDFVSLDEIDPVYFDRGYYAVPTPEAGRPYRLLVEVLTKKQKVGIAKVVMHGKEYLAALRPVDDVLCMETMHFGDEVVSAAKMTDPDAKGKVDARELKIAEQLIDSLTTEFKPGSYHDEYREKVMELIEKKAAGEKVVLRPAGEKSPPKGRDLMAALEASLQKAKGGDGVKGHAEAEEVGMTAAPSSLTVGGRRVGLSNLDKPLYPSGFTKGEVVEYYLRVAPYLLPHLKGRAVTLKRYPGGTDKPFFFEKNCSAHRPEWVKTTNVASRRGEGGVNHCLIGDRQSLLWVANLAVLELHVPLARADAPHRPTAVVFDLDPGPPAGLADCCKVALRLRDVLGQLGLECWAKTSGGKGLHVYVPLNTPVTFEQTKAFALAVAALFAKRHPEQVTATMNRAVRPGKVFVDWSQNDAHKTTACVYSLRAGESPAVSTPIGWSEVDAAVQRFSGRLAFTPVDALARVSAGGDGFSPLLRLRQRLPDLLG